MSGTQPARRGQRAATPGRGGGTPGQGGDPLSQPGVAARVTALRALANLHEPDAAAVPAVHTALEASALNRRDRALAASLAYETTRWQGTLDWALSHVSNRPVAELDTGVRDALRLGAWQLLLSRAPDAAAVSTTVAAAGHVVGPRVRGFVNGVLRALARARDDLPWPDRGTDEGLALALGYPVWIAAEARARFGDDAEAVLAAGNASPGVTLRATGGPGAREALLAELAEAGVDAQPSPHAPESVRAPGADPSRLACVAQGRAVVQDDASTLVGRCAAQVGGAVAGPAAGIAADVCAAPGGKALHLAEQGWTVIAGDVHAGRVAAMADVAGGHPRGAGVHPLVADGRRSALRRAAAEVVLVDAPCTGLGVVRRQPELRWRVQPEDAPRLARRQHELVTAAANLVAPGGLLIVSVCTWTLSETRAAARDADAALGSSFTWEPPQAVAGLGSAEAGGAGRQLAAHRDGVDGMYVAVRRRREEGEAAPDGR